MYVPPQGSPYKPLFAETMHDFLPSQFFLIIGNGLLDEHDVVFTLGSLHVLMSVLPYVASKIRIVFFLGHDILPFKPSQITFSIPVSGFPLNTDIFII